MTENFEPINIVEQHDGTLFVSFKHRPYIWCIVDFAGFDFTSYKCEQVSTSEEKVLVEKLFQQIIKPEFHNLLERLEA